MNTDLTSEIQRRQQERSTIAQERASLRAQDEALVRKDDILAAELRGLELALSVLKPSEARLRSNVSVNAKASVSRGRQPGSITRKWRDVLAAFYAQSAIFGEQDIINAGRELSLSMKPSDARGRLESFEQNEYIETIDEGRYRVTEYAAEKFGFEGHGQPKGLEETTEPFEREIETKDAARANGQPLPGIGGLMASVSTLSLPEGLIGLEGFTGKGPGARTPSPLLWNNPKSHHR